MYNNRIKHYISLGFFCSVALELERVGLRETSSPFDWLIGDFDGVIRAIENHFSGWLSYDNLAQNQKYRNQYRDDLYKCQFFHDFNKYDSLEEQIDVIKDKYQRRIDRFYRMISEPTLFLRYIRDEKDANGKNKELSYIENNYEHIQNLIKSFNKENAIIFIANEEVKSHLVKIYNVKKDEGDLVARVFLEKNKELRNLLCECEYENRRKNLKIYKRKKRQETKNKIKNRINITRRLNNNQKDEYIHDRQYTTLVDNSVIK